MSEFANTSRNLKYEELVDISRLQELMENLYRVIGVANGIYDLEGKALALADWQPVCSNFHRTNAQTCQRCIESDKSLLQSTQQGASFAVHKCLNGLIDAVAPIVVAGEHVANIFTGQFLTEPPDMAFFRRQAHQFGFDEESYLEAIRQVPVLPPERVKDITCLYAQLASMLATRAGALATSEERLRLALDAAEQVVFDLDFRTGEVEVRPQKPELLGYDLAEFQTNFQNFLDSVHPDDRPAVMALFQEAQATNEIVEGSYRRQTKSGNWMWIRSVARVVERDSEGKPLRMIGVHTNITEQKTAEAELDRHRNHLEQLVDDRTAALSIAMEASDAANRAKTTFLANMSHELRTPINHIMGMTELAKWKATDPKQVDHLNKVTQASNNLLAIISDVLLFAEIEAEQLSLEQIDFTLASVVDNLTNLSSVKAKAKGLGLSIDIVPELTRLPLQGDPVRLGQILLTLTTNAIKFTEAGSVTVRLFAMEETPETIRLRAEITDTGIGISDEDQNRLFTAFEQADSSTTRKYGGVGLGLIISKRLVRAMEGDIGVDSQVGAGSTFWFTARLNKHVGDIGETPVTVEPKVAERATYLL